MPATFYSETDWEQSSEPFVNRQVAVADLWPQGARSVSGTKDVPGAGDHVVLAVGGMTVADGRPDNVIGVLVSYTDANLCTLNIAEGYIIRAYVSNILTYNAGAPATWEGAPVIGQPVYIDDSDDLQEGTTLSMSPLNTAGLANPQAGVLWYCQDEYVDSGVGGPNVSAVWPQTWSAIADEENLVCVLLTGANTQ